MHKGGSSGSGVDVFNVTKRTRRTADSLESSSGGGRGRAKITNTNASAPGITTTFGGTPSGPVVNGVGPSSIAAEAGSSRPIAPTRIKERRLRAPPAKLPVQGRELNTWEKLDSVMAPITFKDWIVNDKAARKQLKDGIRFLDGRRGKAPANPIAINMVGGEDISSSTGYDSENSSNYDVTDTISDEERSLEYEGDSDDDTLYEYPYKKVVLEALSPLSVIGTIHGQPIRMVVDTGAAVSVMDKSVAEKFNLVASADTIPISTIETTKKGQKYNVCHVTASVPIRVGGKLRAEHFVIKDDTYTMKRSEPVVLLGMTWLKQYDIKVHARDCLVEIPVKNGGSSITVQGTSNVCDRASSTQDVYCVSVSGNSFGVNISDLDNITMAVNQVRTTGTSDNDNGIDKVGGCAEVNFIMST